MNTVLMLDEAIEKLQEYKDKYGNIPVLLGISGRVESIDGSNYYAVDILGDDDGVVIYNY